MSDASDRDPAGGTPEIARGQTEPSDAILTVPNLLTLLRLALLPLFMWLALGPEQDAAAWSVGLVLGSTDWVDGVVARRLGQVSRLGEAMDPLIDRIVTAAAGVVMVLRDLVPLWAVAAIVARDLLLLAGLPLLSRRGVARPPVNTLGKKATFGLLWSFGLFMAVTIPDPPATWLRPAAWALFGAGITLSYAAAAQYVRTVLASLRAREAETGA